jgi:hypothetical protein
LEEEQQRAAENNNYMMNNYDENAQMVDEYDEMYSHDNNENTYEDMNKLENRDIMHNRNDTNNNANGELYGYHNHHQPHYDDQLKNKTNLAVNNNLSEEEYYEDYEDEDKMLKQQQDRYEEEFDIEYAQNSSTTSKQQQQIIQKQMSVLSEDAHQNDEYMNGKNSMLTDEERALQDEYLDEYPEDEQIVSHHKPSAVSSMMRKQESVLEDDPELKLLEEKQIQKNQQMQQQQLNNELYPQMNDPQMDQFVELEMKQKKMVSINTDGDLILPEKPRELRTAKQRWHWAYNRIVHQARVSKLFPI